MREYDMCDRGTRNTQFQQRAPWLVNGSGLLEIYGPMLLAKDSALPGMCLTKPIQGSQLSSLTEEHGSIH